VPPKADVLTCYKHGLSGIPDFAVQTEARVPRDAPFHPLAGGRTPITILLQALNFHHFFFFGLAHVFHLLDFVVGEALDLFHGALFLVFRNLLVF